MLSPTGERMRCAGGAGRSRLSPGIWAGTARPSGVCERGTGAGQAVCGRAGGGVACDDQSQDFRRACHRSPTNSEADAVITGLGVPARQSGSPRGWVHRRDRPTSAPSSRPAARPMTRPMSRPATSPAATPVTRNTVSPMAKPMSRPAISPASRPTRSPAMSKAGTGSPTCPFAACHTASGDVDPANRQQMLRTIHLFIVRLVNRRRAGGEGPAVGGKGQGSRGRNPSGSIRRTRTSVARRRVGAYWPAWPTPTMT